MTGEFSELESVGAGLLIAASDAIGITIDGCFRIDFGIVADLGAVDGLLIALEGPEPFSIVFAGFETILTDFPFRASFSFRDSILGAAGFSTGEGDRRTT